MEENGGKVRYFVVNGNNSWVDPNSLCFREENGVTHLIFKNGKKNFSAYHSLNVLLTLHYKEVDKYELLFY